MNVGKKQTGFTIVELLIVVVVIAILAAITIVAYNGVANRAKASAAQTAVSQAVKKIYAYAVDNADTYPEATGTMGTDNLGSLGLTNANNTSYQYSANNTNKTFCLTATSNGISYYQNNTTASSPTAGACPGHNNNGATIVTNLVSRPIPSSTTPFNYEVGNGTAALSWATTGGGNIANGSWQRLTFSTGSTSGSVQQGIGFSNASTLAANTTYTWSIYVRSSASVNVMPYLFLNPGNK